MTQCGETFENALIDLVYDELPSEDAAALKAHLEGCASCSAAYERYRLTRTMAAQAEAVAPPVAMDAVILAAADARCSTIGDAPATLSRPDLMSESEESAVSKLGRMLRGMLLKPAFATAAIACTVLLVTVFLVNRMTPSSTDEGNVASLLEKAPLGPVVPPPPPQPEQADHLSPSAPEESAPLPSTLPPEPPSPTESKKGKGASESAMSAPMPAKSAPAATAPDNDDLQPRSPKPAASLRKSRLPLDGLASPYDNEIASSRSARAESSGAAEKPFSEAEPRGKATAKKSAVSREGDADAFEQGMNAYERGDCNSAIPAFEQVVSAPNRYPGKRALAMHHIARCEKQRGRCGNAMTWYDNLISDHPAYPGMPSALWEASACCRRLGRTGRARELLEMLSTIPGWEARAREQLDTL